MFEKPNTHSDPDSKPTNCPKTVRLKSAVLLKLKSANAGGEEHESEAISWPCHVDTIIIPIYLRPITESQNKFQNQRQPKQTKAPKKNKRNCTLSKKPNRLSTFTRKHSKRRKQGVQNALNNKEAFCLAPGKDFHRASRLLSRLFPFLQ